MILSRLVSSSGFFCEQCQKGVLRLVALKERSFVPSRARNSGGRGTAIRVEAIGLALPLQGNPVQYEQPAAYFRASL